MKFLFINKPFKIEPLGLMYLSSVIKQENHEIDLVLTSENLEEKVSKFNPDFIGYSIMTGDQSFYDLINKQLKKQFNFISVVGGPHPTFFPEMLENSSFDGLCIGEGEKSIKFLLNNPQSKKVPNFWFKEKDKIIKNDVQPLIENLDDILFPNREIVFKYPEIGKNGPIKHFIASRGCPYNCSYCFNESYSKIYSEKGKRVRFRSVNNLINEIEEVISSSPTKFVYFQDDTFILRPEWLKNFSQEYNKKIKLPFHCHTRANLVKEDIVENLKLAGCYSIHIAAESGNDSIRKSILNRTMSNEEIYSAVSLFKKYNIKVMLQNILGLPFSSLKNDLETLELNIKCKPDYAWASIFQPYPKTELGEKCVNSGLYSGDFSDIKNNFFDKSVLNIQNKNEISNLQKLFAVAVEYPEFYYSGILQKLIELPYETNKEEFNEIYASFRKVGDKRLYGFEL